jgi:hypothetical protein
MELGDKMGPRPIVSPEKFEALMKLMTGVNDR